MAPRAQTGTVTVTGPPGRIVYKNGNYTPGYPKTIPNTFTVRYGENLFETLDKDGKIDFRERVTTNDDNENCTIILKPVSPPESM